MITMEMNWALYFHSVRNSFFKSISKNLISCLSYAPKARNYQSTSSADRG